MRGKRALILSLVERWIQPMGLGNWQVKVYFPGRVKEIASAVTQSEYRTLDLYFNLKRVPDVESDIRELVAHELTHAHVEALAELANRGARRTPERKESIRMAEETLVTTVSRLLLPYLP